MAKSEVLVLRPNPKKPKNKVTLQIDGTPVTEKDTFKIVGLRISNKLDFRPQIEYLTKRINQKIGALKRLSYKVNKEAMIKVANATILRNISYTLMFIATPNIDETTKANGNHKALQKLINKTGRIILKKKFSTKFR